MTQNLEPSCRPQLTTLKLIFCRSWEGIVPNHCLKMQFFLPTTCLNVALNSGITWVRASTVWINIENGTRGKLVVNTSESGPKPASHSRVGKIRICSSIFPYFPVCCLIFPQILFIFFLILVFRVGGSPIPECPGYATGLSGAKLCPWSCWL